MRPTERGWATSNRQAGSDVATAGALPRRGRPRAQVAAVSAFQRSRLLAAALQEVSERGIGRTSVAVVVARAGVSRKTFYELFTSRDDCLRAAFEQAVAEIADAVAPAYADTDGSWSQRLRAAVVALLAYLELHRDTAAFALGYIVEDASRDPQSRAWVLERLQGVLEQGRYQASSLQQASPLAAEVMVGGALAALHERVRTRSWNLGALVNPLMWMIVLPYLGPAAAARELRRAPPARAARPARSDRALLEGLSMRVTYRTTRVLRAIAEQPGRSNAETGAEVGIVDPGQMSKLLARLLGYGLIENVGPGWSAGGANAWRLTRKGEQVNAAIGHRSAAHGLPRSAA